ncbi:hypothetical protein NDU88_003573 [Pleurodeles waltl]|uniref:Uncharacterized protein n=1 Tax=Pleurodeles waltl TaxID=8319 RepID=A0AAV7KYH1_PLEWA|nr:hypothetical protein NDU88_003573 [Pleurodeles waltl]
MLHNLALRRQVLFLQEDGPDVGLVAAVEPVDSEEEEAEEEDIDNRNNIIMQYFHLSLTFGVADLCGCLYCGGLRDVGRNTCSGFPLRRRYLDGRQHGVKRDLTPGL